ncbi:MAG TPA: YcxB family protein [Acidobacteriaceae bacterium]|nr:YcxB family protein [Acidobacteriaceae bacterium]
MIEAEYTISYADYKAANRLYLWQGPRTRIGYTLSMFVFPVIGLSFSAWGLWLRISGNPGFLDASLTNLLLFALFAICFPLIRWRLLRVGFRGLLPKGSGNTVRLRADDEQVIFSVPGSAEGRYFWNAFVNFAENEKVLILIVSRTRYLLVPRHALTETQWTELRALAAAKLPRS